MKKKRELPSTRKVPRPADVRRALARMKVELKLHTEAERNAAHFTQRWAHADRRTAWAHAIDILKEECRL